MSVRFSLAADGFAIDVEVGDDVERRTVGKISMSGLFHGTIGADTADLRLIADKCEEIRGKIKESLSPGIHRTIS